MRSKLIQRTRNDDVAILFVHGGRSVHVLRARSCSVPARGRSRDTSSIRSVTRVEVSKRFVLTNRRDGSAANHDHQYTGRREMDSAGPADRSMGCRAEVELEKSAQRRQWAKLRGRYEGSDVHRRKW